MSRETIGLSDGLASWMETHALRESAVQQQLRAAMGSHPRGGMQTAPEQVAFMQVLMKLIDAKRVIEIGVFTGYSALGMAAALPDDGVLLACDIDAQYLEEAEQWWVKAGVADRIESRLGPAVDTLDALIADGASGTIDFVYSDADKESSAAYYERSLKLLRPGGIFAIDNMFLGGRVVDMDDSEPSVVATREIAHVLSTDDRIDWSLVPIGDGLGVARVK